MAVLKLPTYEECMKNSLLKEMEEAGEAEPTMQQVFDFESAEVRTITDNEGIWFALIDVCAVLGTKNSRDIVKRLDEDELRNFNLRSRAGDTWFVNEPGLYHVLLTSRSEKAKPFRRWVTHEVLPSIRKHGFYSMIPDSELLDVLWERIKNKPQLISKVFVERKDQTAFKKYVVDKELADLWKQRAEIDSSEYEQRLAEICNLNVNRYTAEYARYLKWREAHRSLQRYAESRDSAGGAT